MKNKKIFILLEVTKKKYRFMIDLINIYYETLQKNINKYQ